MTIRLPDELDVKVEAIARARHISKHAVIIDAVDRFTAQESKTARVLAAVDAIGVEYAETMKRLEDA